MIGPEEHPTWVSQHHFLPQLQTLHLQGIYEHKYVKTSPTQGTGEAFSSPCSFLVLADTSRCGLSKKQTYHRVSAQVTDEQGGQL